MLIYIAGLMGVSDDLKEAAKIGDFFVTVTGCDKVIDAEDFVEMKEGAILCNAGHFDCEIDMAGLRAMAVETKETSCPQASGSSYLQKAVW